MRILIISFFFPPYNAIGAVRVGKEAKYLAALGHEVRVITASDQTLPKTLPLEIPEECVRRTSWFNVNKIVEFIFNRKKVAATGYSASVQKYGLLRKLAYLYKVVVNLPDGQIGWYPYAVAEGGRVIKTWQPDVIYASAMPVTSLLVAKRLSKKHQIPWVAEMRDLWMDNPYLDYYPRWRGWYELRLEKKVMSTASGMVTISQPLVDTLEKKYQCPVCLVTNGFDPDDFAKTVPERVQDNDVLHIVYTGMIYLGKRDPSPLFEAIAALGDLKQSIKVSFYGRYLTAVSALAHEFGVASQVEVHMPVAYNEALLLQQQADLLLLLLWNDPKEKGSFTGKVFEYLGAKRPVLILGPSDNVASELVTSRQAGVVFDSMGTPLVEQLRQWVLLKQSGQDLPALPEGVGAGYTRQEQTEILSSFLGKVVNS